MGGCTDFDSGVRRPKDSNSPAGVLEPVALFRQDACHQLLTTDLLTKTVLPASAPLLS